MTVIDSQSGSLLGNLNVRDPKHIVESNTGQIKSPYQINDITVKREDEKVWVISAHEGSYQQILLVLFYKG